MIRHNLVVGASCGLLVLASGATAHGQCTPLQRLSSTSLTPSAVATNDEFVFVGSDLNDVGGVNVGTAFVFKFNGTGWSQQQQLFPSDLTPESNFGAAVAVDGSTLVVTATGAFGAASNSGAAYVFELMDGEWIQTQKLFAADGQNADEYGYAVAVKDDLLLVGARLDDDGGSNVGSAYVYRRVSGVWTFEQKLHGSTVGSTPAFGRSVAILDGALFVGASLDSEFGLRAGAVFVFEHDGLSWNQTQKIQGDPSFGGFGRTLMTDGDVVFAGGGTQALMLRRTGGVWLVDEQLAPPPGVTNRFGWELTLHGNFAIVTDSLGDPGHNGVIHVFHYTASEWRHLMTVVCPTVGSNIEFGAHATISGNVAFVSTRSNVFALCLGPCAHDSDGSGAIDLPDIATVLANFAQVAGPEDGDVDLDGVVTLNDLALMLSMIGDTCP